MRIANKYEIIEKIGQGAFGSVFKGQNIRTKEFVAIKFEEKINKMRSLKNEAKIYQYLANIDGFPQLKWYGSLNNYSYLVVDLLGKSLNHFNEPFVTDIAYNIGIQMIRLIQKLHDMHLIHRDIKPSNFLFGTGNKTNIIHLIDFGFTKRYDYDGNHIEEKYINNIIGSPNFVSLNVHNLVEPSRRDDLESCIYIILTMLYNNIPWTQNGLNLNTIYLLKKQILTTDIPEVIKTALNYVRSLSFDERPDYHYLIELFTL